MKRKYSRAEFIKLTGLAGAAVLIGACNSQSPTDADDPEKKVEEPDPEKVIEPSTEKHQLTVYRKGDKEYDQFRQGFNKRIDKFPAMIVLCKSTEDVVAAVMLAKENSLPVAIKSGGHCFEGFSCNNGGLVINLSKLNKIEWLDDNRIKVGPGCTLSELYDELLPKKKILPAGSCGSVGIGGLTLGGGYGFFSREHGLTCDSLQELTLVDGNGKIHLSSADNDLLWASRGGGNGNFGVVTSMTFKLQSAPGTFTSHRFKAFNLTSERAFSLLEKWFSLTPLLPLTSFSAFVLNGKTLTLLITNYGEHTDKLEEAIKAITESVDQAKTGKPVRLSAALKNYYGISHPLYFKNASAGLYNGFDEVRDVLPEVLSKVVSTPGMIYQVNTLGGLINDVRFQQGSAFAHRDCAYLSELQCYWETPKHGEKLIAAFEQVQTLFSEAGITRQYRNYPDLNFKKWNDSYFGANLSRLKKMKAKYDPDDLFRFEQSLKA